MRKKSLIWKIPCITLAVVLGIALLLLIALTVVLTTPRTRTALLQKGVEIANERTDLDIDLQRLYLSPFYHSPKSLYRAYKGKEDLPVHVEIDSLFIGHRGQDTLLYVHTLRLKGTMKGDPDVDLLSRTIVVDSLLLESATMHSDTLLPDIGINALVGHLQVKSPGLNIGKGQFPLSGLRLSDTFLGLDLRNNTPVEMSPEDIAPLSFELSDGEIRHFRLAIDPIDLGLAIGSLSTDAVADVSGNRYDARSLMITDAALAIGPLTLPFEEVQGNAAVDLGTGLIRSGRLFARSETFGAKADVSTTLNLETLQADVAGEADFRGSKARLKGFYDIDDERYDMQVDVEKVNVSPFLGDAHRVEVAGAIHARGRGIDIHSPAIRSKVNVHLTDCIYDDINVSGLELDASLSGKTVDGSLILPFSMKGDSLQLKARTEHIFSVSDFLAPSRMGVNCHSQINDLFAHVAGEDLYIDRLNMDFDTDSNTSLRAVTQGLSLNVKSPMHILTLLDRVTPLLEVVQDTSFVKSITSLKDLTRLDTLRHLIPDLEADIRLAENSPVHPIIRNKGLDISEFSLSLDSDPTRSDLALNAAIPAIGNPADSTALRLPAATASMLVNMKEGTTAASLKAHSPITDGLMNVDGLRTDATFQLDLQRFGRELNGTGHLALDGLRFNDMDLGDRTADIRISPSEAYDNALRADVRLNDIPTELVSGILQQEDIGLGGFVQATAVADGLPANLDLSAEVLPRGLSVLYKPYDVKLTLGETPIVMLHNKVDFNGLRIYGADSTYLSLSGGMDLGTQILDIGLAAEIFCPTPLPKDGPIPVYGNLATDIRGSVTGSLDAILANVDVTVLPTTEITYPIDKKNLAQVQPHGTVNVLYGVAEGQLNLGGKLLIDDGVVRYSPKLYPIMPFKVDPGSHVTFNGPPGQTLINVSASQQVKADVQSEGEETRRVTFNTGVRVNGVLDSLGLNAIGFFLEAPQDETITREIASMDEDTRDGIAAALLATGMYMGDSNEAAQKSGYALSSIINSRINAAMANSKMGEIIEVDISSGETEHASGRTSDMNIVISKALFKDRLRLTVGSVISDNPEVNKANGFLNHLSADYKLTPSGNMLLRAFSKRDYDNIFEGELFKSGIGLVVTRAWEKGQRSYNFTTDADIAYRSNTSIGPNLNLTYSTRNLMGRGETFAVKAHGAYYWSLRNRQQGDLQRTDTYKFGLDASLTFPYLQWFGDNLPAGDTRYRLGYKYENIAGGYGVHKLSGAFSYFIRPGGYLTHMVTPFSLSLVKTRMSEEFIVATAGNPEALKMMASDEFVPAIAYNITYNDYRSRRRVNTMFDFEIKESGNLVGAISKLPVDRFVKLTAELWNKFAITENVCIATRLYAGAAIPTGGSGGAPLSDNFYAGGPNSLRAAPPYTYGPGNFHSTKFNQNYFHAGEVKLEANAELRFPLFWKINGAVFIDAGNTWNWHNSAEGLDEDEYATLAQFLGLTERLYDGIIDNPYFANQIALGSGAGIRLDLDGLVIRLDLGFGIHAPYQTYRYDKEFKPDYNQPITSYYNMPSVLDALRLNFGIGYPF